MFSEPFMDITKQDLDSNIITVFKFETFSTEQFTGRYNFVFLNHVRELSGVASIVINVKKLTKSLCKLFILFYYFIFTQNKFNPLSFSTRRK